MRRRDLLWNGGFIAGAVVTAVILKSLGILGAMQWIASAAVGVGYMTEKTFNKEN